MNDIRVMTRPDDMHIHFRSGTAMGPYVRDAAAIFGRTLVMPNTDPPIDSVPRLEAYRDAILDAAKQFSHFTPLLTFKLNQRTTPELAGAMKRAGAVAAKLYPDGATTNSADGVTDPEALYPVFEAMSEHRLLLCIHAEDPDAFVLDREVAYLPRVAKIHRTFPDLRIVVEHLSTAEAVRFVLDAGPTVAATITAHHLAMTLDDVLGAGIRPHNYCKPVLKRPEDRRALLEAAVSGSQSFFFGSDSAPHQRAAKECGVGAAGIYTAPFSLSVLAQVFSMELGSDFVGPLQRFASENGARFYEVPQNAGTVELIQEPWVVPESYHDVVPMFPGVELSWRVRSS
jgi:dihydroorotase